MPYSVSETAFRVYIPIEDSESYPAITDTLIETASVLPNTRQMMDEAGNRQILIAQYDEKRWPHLVQEVRQIVNQYEIELADDEEPGVETTV